MDQTHIKKEKKKEKGIILIHQTKPVTLWK